MNFFKKRLSGSKESFPSMDTKSGKKTVAPPPSGEVGAPGKSTSIGNVMGNLRTEHDAMQLKTFTRWWHSWLSPRGVDIDDLCTQIQPGVIGIQLIEALSGTLVGRYNRNPKNTFQKGENHNAFLATIKAKGIKLVNIGADDLQAGDKKLVLGLTWTLILRYEIEKYGADEMELLRWVKKTTSGYDGVKITTWGESFCDGKAFSAICHAFDDKCLDYEKAKKEKPLKCLTTAFDVADKTYGVPKLLEPADLVDGAVRCAPATSTATRHRHSPPPLAYARPPSPATRTRPHARTDPHPPALAHQPVVVPTEPSPGMPRCS